MSIHQHTLTTETHRINKADILRAMAALKIIIEVGVSRGVDMSDEVGSLARLEETFGVGAYSPIVESPQMQ